MTPALAILRYLALLVGTAVLFGLWLWAVSRIFPKPMEPPPPELSTEEVMRRIAALLERGEPVCLATVNPEHAEWARRVHPWPVRWLLGRWIERDLRRPLGGGEGT